MVPALAVADELRAREASVTFLGTADRAEADLVPDAGYELRHLKLKGLDRKNPFKAISALMLSIMGFFKARRMLKDLDADAVLAGGGYVAGTVGMAAASMRVPLVLTEADSHFGLSNRVLVRFARRACLAFPIEGRATERYLVTGRPVPKQTGHVDSDVARDRYGVEQSDWVVLIFGGSIGARSVNFAALDAFAGVESIAGRPLHVLHACGHRDFEPLKERLGTTGAKKYQLMDYVSPDFHTLLAAADVVIARAGGSIFEVAAAGKPSILIPYPHATAGHQRKNAQWMIEGGAAIVLEDEELDGRRLLQETETLLSDRSRLETMAESALKLARPDAAEQVANEVVSATGVAVSAPDNNY